VSAIKPISVDTEGSSKQNIKSSPACVVMAWVSLRIIPWEILLKVMVQH